MAVEMSQDRGAVWTQDRVRPAPSFSPLDLSPTATSMVEPFERQVERTPDRIALKDRTRTLSYRSLNSQANSVGRALLANWKKGHPLVALVMAHTPLKVIAAIGILKAGLGYVALDETAVDSYLLGLLKHCGAPLVVTDRDHYDRLHHLAGSKLEVVLIDALLQRPSEENLNTATTPDQISRIEYTSGSTGTPKGAIYTVANEVFCTISIHNALKLGPEDTLAFLQGFWTTHMLGALYCGATLSIFDLRQESLSAMKRWLREDAITQYSGIVTGFRQFLGALEPEEVFPDMRVVATSGEPLFSSDMEKFQFVFREDCTLVNWYASTEQAVITFFVAGAAFRPPTGGFVPVGIPADGICVELLDENLDPVPDGAVGEIAVTSPFLSPGYWQDPERTEETFVWREDKGRRSYLTGDLARRDASGCLHVLGRKDDQIKIRGYRVLSSEIEHAINAQEGIRESAVIPFGDGFASEKLACYYISESGEPLNLSDLRASLSASLPSYMIPNLFLIREDLPRTGTGKLKRRALPRPHLDELADLSVETSMSDSTLEAQLLLLWKQALNTDQIGTEDNFLEWGGDSLVAMKLVNRIEKELGVAIDVKLLFDHPTISDFARELAAIRASLVTVHL